jgi:hypothetical protein
LARDILRVLQINSLWLEQVLYSPLYPVCEKKLI